MRAYGVLALLACALSLILMLYDVAAIKLFLVALLILLAIRGRLERNTINPFYLFMFTPLSVLIYQPAISGFFLVPFETEVAFLIALSLLVFTLGLMVCKATTHHVEARQYRFWPIFLLGLLPAVLGVVFSGILSASDVDAARSKYYLPIVGQFWVFLPASFLVAVCSGRRPLILLALLANAIFPILIVSKFATLLFAVFVIFAIEQYGRGLMRAARWPSLFLLVTLIPPIFLAFFTARNERSMYEYQWWSNIWFGSDMLDRFGEMLYLPYLYATAPWSNLGFVLESNVPSQYGLLTLRPLISIAQIDSFFVFIDKPVRNIAMNTHTYIADFYIDFGFAGSLLMSFLLGVAVSKIYRQAAIGDAFEQSLWVLFAFATFMMFFSNHFTSVGYPIIAALLYLSARRLPFLMKRPSCRSYG